MATNTASVTLVSLDSYRGGWVGYGTNVKGFVGYTGEYRGVSIVKFTTPSFVGASESIDFKFRVAPSKSDVTSFTIRYAICTKDTNKSKYLDTKSSVSDSYQIAAGSTTLDGLSASGTGTTETISVNTSSLSSSTTYYLFLWGDSDTRYIVIQGFDETDYESATLNYNQGLVYIDSGSGFEAYQVYIDNGSGWDLYIPYIDNGSSWDLYS